MKKRLIAMTLAGALAVSSLAGCGGGGGSEPASGSASGEDSVPHWTIGYSNRLDTDAFLKKSEDEFIKLVEADDTLDIITADAEGDSQKQLDQLDNFNIQGVDCVVLVPQDGETVVDHVEEWNENGIPVFCSSQAAGGGEFTFVGASDYELGLMKCQWAHDNLPENAKVLYLGGNLGYQTSIDRRQAVVDGLAERLYKDFNGDVVNEDGDIEVLSWQECMYTPEEGMQIMEDWIQTFSDFDAVISVSDQPTLGALEALKGAGIDDVMVVSIDGLDDAVQAVKDGTLACTIQQNAKVHAQALYDAIKTAQRGEENPAVINPEPKLIDSSNVDEFLE